jgi:inner membrane protein
MLVLGHAGITLGTATIFTGVVKNLRSPQINRFAWFTALSSYVDIRILLVGSLLPDIIDKPVGQFFFKETFHNGRIFSHTLIFLVLITMVGFYLYRRRRQVWLLTLAGGTFTHLVLDEMWQFPRTLFWPFLGFNFASEDLTHWLSNIFLSLTSSPEIYLSEAVGLAIILWLGLVIVSRKKVGVFIRYGRLS